MRAERDARRPGDAAVSEKDWPRPQRLGFPGFRRRPRVAPIVSVVCVCLCASPAAAALVSWADFTGVVSTSASNTVPYASGSVTVSTNPLISVRAGGFSSFATTSDRYSNIDTARFDVLAVAPAASQTGSPYEIEFDFTGTSLNRGGAINVAGLFYHPSRGAFTEFTVQAFGVDDVTPFSLADLAFEQHAWVGSGGATGADALLAWNPSTGLLTVAPGPTEAINSRFGFFSPMRGRIGRITFTARTLTIASNGDEVYFGLAAVACAPLPALEGARCQVARVGEAEGCTDPLFAALERLLRKNTRKIVTLLQRALDGPSAARVRRLATKSDRKLARLERRLEARRIVANVPEACRMKLAELIGEARALLQSHLSSGS